MPTQARSPALRHPTGFLWGGSAVLGLGLLLSIPASPIHLARVWVDPPRQEGKTVAQWLAILQRPDPKEKSAALAALVQLPTDLGPKAVMIAEHLAAEQNEPVRILASVWLAKAIVLPESVLPHLVKALEDEDAQVRANVARAILRLGPGARPAVATLVREIPRSIHQEYSVYTTTIQETLILALGKSLSGGSPATSEGTIPQDLRLGLDTLGQLVDHGATQEIKNAAIRALGMAGPIAQSQVERIRQTASREFWPYKEDAREALQAIGVIWDPAKEITKVEQLVLPSADREAIWKIEHHGNLLGKYGFGPLGKALSSRDRLLLGSFLAPGFRFERRLTRTGAEETRPDFSVQRQGECERGEVLGSPEFLDQLLGQRAHFGAGSVQAKFGVLGIGPIRKDQWDGPWEVRCQLRLHGCDDAKGPVEVLSHWRLIMARPTKENLEKPGWLQSAEIQDQLVGKARQPLFQEVAQARGLKADGLYDHWNGGRFVSWTGGAFVCDFDHDGWLDLLVTDIQGGSLYRGGPGGRMTDVTRDFGLAGHLSRAVAAAWVDIDQDGWEDLILDRGVLRNEQGKAFVDKTDLVRARFPEDYTNVLIADYDRDGKPDLYFTRTGKPGLNSWLEGRSDDHRTNLLYRNLGGWRFENVTDKAGVAGGNFSTFCAVWFDADNDGWPDLHCPNEFGDGTLFINQKNGTFRAAVLGPAPVDFGTMGLAAGDLNNDGLIDLYCANMYSKAGTRVIGNLPPAAFPNPVVDKMRRFVAGSQLHLNQGHGAFRQVGQAMRVHGVGWAYGPGLADLDNDGWLDIYATAGYCSRDRNEPDG